MLSLFSLASFISRLSSSRCDSCDGQNASCRKRWGSRTSGFFSLEVSVSPSSCFVCLLPLCSGVRMTLRWKRWESQRTSGFSSPPPTFFSFFRSSRSSRLLEARGGGLSSSGSLPNLESGLLGGFAIEGVSELVVELGRRPVEAMGVLQGRRIRRGHEECPRCGDGSRESGLPVVGENVKVPPPPLIHEVHGREIGQATTRGPTTALTH